MKAALIGLLAASLVIGCTYRGPTTGFAVVSTRALSAPMSLVAREVEGRSCIGPPTQDRSPEAEAVAVALQNAPGRTRSSTPLDLRSPPSGSALACTAVRSSPADAARAAAAVTIPAP
jgi:hypothetical protein